MNVLSAESLSKSYNDRWLFKELTLGLSQGDKVALVGANGTGKTTLLRTLGGILPADGGNVSLRNGLRRAYLEQQPNPDPELTIEQTIFTADNPIATAVKNYERAITHSDTTDDQMQDALHAMEEHNAWDYEARVHQVLGKLSIHDLDQKVGSLSGGQRKRVALAQLVLSEPDMILLDEPTNHLDLEAIEWLENYLRSAQVTLLMVTHDRYFLDNVTNSICELERGQLYRYEGNYSYFLEKKAERLANAQTVIDKARNLMTKELEWMRRQPKARGTKAKYRIEAFGELKEIASQNLRIDSMKLDVLQKRQGGKVLELENVTKQFGANLVLKNFSYIFRKGDRIGLVGRNGVGKSSFLNTITGRLAPDSGEVIWGQTTRVGYYTQEIDNLNPDNRIIDEVKEIAEFVPLSDGTQVSVSKLLEMFLFPPAQQYGLIGKLSGGERRRLQLLKVLVASPNFLILDEPTNDLDLDTLNVLEEFLEQFQGCLVLVSHDRYFMDHLVDHLFIFEGEGKIKDYNGNYSDYRDEQDELEAPTKPSALSPNKSNSPSPPQGGEKGSGGERGAPRKLTSKEQSELDKLPAQIEALEAKSRTLTEQLTAAGSDFKRIQTLSKEIETLTKETDQKTERWMELGG